MTILQGLMIRLFITFVLYIILTLPYLSYALFNFGIDYGKYGCMFCGFLTIISAPTIQKKLNLDYK